jgi:hypothetical protein
MTQDEVKQILNNDSATGEFTWLVPRGTKIKIGDRAGNLRPDGYRRIYVDGKGHLEHRLVWLYYYGYLPTKPLDHINGIRNDNRIDNLREACHAENGQNMGKNKNNTSGFTGVTFHKPTGKWMAHIAKNGKKYHLGLFYTPEEAHDAYLKAKANLHTFQPTLRK